MERQVAALPATGTDAYWVALANPDLPMEVLARCLRERLNAGNAQAVARIYELVLLRVERSNQAWARKTAQIAGRGQAAELAEDLEQEVRAALWEELKSERKFIEVSFGSVLRRLRQHVATTYMQREGYWQRKGVATPERVPRRLIESLTPPEEDDADMLGLGPRQLPADPKAEAEFTAIEAAEIVQKLLDLLSPRDRELLYLTFEGGLTQEELAAHFNVTDRSIREWRTKALALLRAYLNRRGGPHD